MHDLRCTYDPSALRSEGFRFLIVPLFPPFKNKVFHSNFNDAMDELICFITYLICFSLLFGYVDLFIEGDLI